jgi:hypothetical protein
MQSHAACQNDPRSQLADTLAIGNWAVRNAAFRRCLVHVSVACLSVQADQIAPGSGGQIKPMVENRLSAEALLDFVSTEETEGAAQGEAAEEGETDDDAEQRGR